MLDKALTIIKGLHSGFAVGVSGGADSMCLLSLIIRAGKKNAVTAINVDHGIRENSKADSLFVRDFCEKNDIKFVGRKIDVPAAAQVSGRSIETEARLMRHAIFKEFCDTHDVPLVLAHNKGDNAESLLMHIFRGCGIRGLAGMSEIDGRFIRPLIYAEKSEIYDYVRQNNIPYVEDETNADLSYSRNRIRALIAEAEKCFPGARGAIVSLSGIAKDTQKFIESQLDKSFFKNDNTFLWLKDAKKQAVLLDKRALQGFLAGEYIYQAALKAGLAIDLEQKHILAVIELAGLQTGKSIDLPHGLRVFNEHDNLAFEFYSQPVSESKNFDNNYGEQEFCGIKIKVLPVALTGLDKIKRQNNRLFVDLDKLCGAKLRLRRDGDRFWPCGGCGKKLKEFFNEKKVPYRVRDYLPLITAEDDILVIPGLKVSETVKITHKTLRAAEILIDLS